MQISPFIIYLWGIVDSISSAAVCLALMGTIGGALALLFYYVEDETKLRRPAIAALCMGFVALLVAVFTPSSKTLALMVVVPAIVNSEPIQKDLPELYNIAVEALKENLSPKQK